LIKYALQCDSGHPFEGWFGASSDFDDQVERGLVTCPTCESAAVAKQIMAPAVAGTKMREITPSPTLQEMMMQAAQTVRAHVEENFDYVGDAFAAEARAIHEGASQERPIYGEATPTQVEALQRDGIKVAALPPPLPRKTDIN